MEFSAAGIKPERVPRKETYRRDCPTVDKKGTYQNTIISVVQSTLTPRCLRKGEPMNGTTQRDPPGLNLCYTHPV